MIDLVVFDLAGTTVKDNDDVPRVLQQAMEQHGVSVSIADAKHVMGIPKPIAIRTLLHERYDGLRNIDDQWIMEIHHQFVQSMIAFYRHDPTVMEMPGASDTFKRLTAQGIKVVVDTGFDRTITDALLKRLGWVEQQLIDASVTSDEVAQGRPHADLIFRAMALTNVSDVRRVAKVGDTPSDIGEGRAAGCAYIIGVTTGAFSRDDLQKENPTHLVDNIADVIKILDMS